MVALFKITFLLFIEIPGDEIDFREMSQANQRLRSVKRRSRTRSGKLRYRCLEYKTLAASSHQTA